MAVALVATDEHGPEFYSSSGEIITLSNISITANNVLLLSVGSGTDVNVATAVNLNTTAATTTYDQPFTLVQENTSGTTRFSLWRRVLSGSEGTAIKITTDGGISAGVTIIRDFNGVDTTTPISTSAKDVTNASTNTTAQDTGTVSSSDSGLATVWVSVGDGRAYEDPTWGSVINSYEVGNHQVGGATWTGTIAYTGGSGNVSDTLTTADAGDTAVGIIALLKEASGGGPAFDETAAITASVIATANETATAPGYTETAAVTASVTATAVETYSAGGFDETAAIAASVTATAAETYSAGGFDETAAIAASVTATAAETYTAPGYSESAAIGAAVTATAVETYSASGFSESALIDASVTATAVETFAPPSPAYAESATIAASVTATAVETYTGPVYTESAAVGLAALISASEIYLGPGGAESASISAAVTLTAAETFTPAPFAEQATIGITATITASETFTTPSALPGGISDLSATSLGGFKATRI